MTLNEYLDYLVKWLQLQIQKANAKGVIVGISGGIDSAVVAALAKKAFPHNSLGLIMPINKMNKDLTDALELASKIKIEYQIINLQKTYITITKELAIVNPLSLANIKPRLRMTTLYAKGQEKGYLVLGTDNQAEWETGYFTKHGDGGADLLPIINLTKTNVRKAAKILGVPESIINKAPSAGLWEGQEDEKEMGVTYEEIDAYLEGKEIHAIAKAKIQKMHKLTDHKRSPIPKPKRFI